MLAAPLVLEYVPDYQKNAVTWFVVLGIAAACVLLPVVGFGVAAGEAGAAVASVVAACQYARMAHGEPCTSLEFRMRAAVFAFVKLVQARVVIQYKSSVGNIVAIHSA